MAKASLSKSSSKLNLTRRQTYVFQKIIFVGNQMAELLARLEFKITHPARVKEATKLAKRWSSLMIQLAKLLS